MRCRKAARVVSATVPLIFAATCTTSSGDARPPSRNGDRQAVNVDQARLRGSCLATPGSLTPVTWRLAAASSEAGPLGALVPVVDVALPGPADRFDYQSIDQGSRRLWISHMGAGRVVVFNLDSDRVVGEVADLPRATGVLAVPGHNAVYVSAAGAHQIAVVDDRTLRVITRIDGARFPDGIAYVPDVDKLFVSDESGESSVVIDAATRTRRSIIPLGGEAGNTHYDSVSHCVLVAIQTSNQLVAIDADAERIVRRYDLPGINTPHGFALDEAGRRAFVSGAGDGALLVLDLRTMRVIQRLRVGDGPDVVAWDPGWRRLYVASESGVLSEFSAAGDSLLAVGELRAPHAHSVAVDSRTHRVYLPLENVGGHPVLRVLVPGTGRR